MIIMLLIGAVFGLLAGTLIEEFNMQPFIATLSTMFPPVVLPPSSPPTR